MSDTLKTPFPYFGGKSRVASLVWQRLGQVGNYIEPFAGSLAVLLRRPQPLTGVETVNDLDCHLANFWRATQHAPEAVAEHADGPVNEADLHARHRWLVGIDSLPTTPYLHALAAPGRVAQERAAFRQRMRTDPEFYDAKVAGWWCWGLCCWIGGGWCAAHGETADGDRKQTGPQLAQVGKGVTHKGKAFSRVQNQMPAAAGGLVCGVHAAHPTGGKRPAINHAQGVHAIRGGRPQLADAFDVGRGVKSNGDLATCADRRAWLLDWFGRLRDRLRLVRVCCGDWLRVCNSESVTTRIGTTGIFLDPPYGDAAGRAMSLYAYDSGTVATDVRAYCLERGGDNAYRICLAGYAGEGHEELEAAGWDVVEWQAVGGYGNRSQKGKANARRERLWFSPHCQPPAQRELFDTIEECV